MAIDQWVAGTRITPLTLALLEDTNFYEIVDKTVSEPASLGIWQRLFICFWRSKCYK
jgi:hypothetical protein